MRKSFQPISRAEMDARAKKAGYMCRNDCPFCDHDRHKQNNSFLSQTGDWMQIHSLGAYRGNTDHLIVFPLKHVEKSVELSIQQILDYKNMLGNIDDFYGEKEYTSFTRESF